MSEDVKEQVKKLNARAIKLKMDLHDLAEELPVGWEHIPDVAAATHTAFRDLAAARARLKKEE
ncbi:MAG: hypothetical protein FD149_429 [Rhodospirillaceae bacterium]|nr:MAG: hypothetical protein FD149_429 [Rhodospirillaceae bacterium]